MASDAIAIATEHLAKEYKVGFSRTKRFLALEDLSLEVEAGINFGFLGPNGAGKSTTIKLLTGLIFPTRGSARIWGGEVGDSAVKRRLGYSPENPSFPDHLSGREVLRFVGTLYGLRGAELNQRADAMLERLGLSRAADVATRKYSKGMVQRLSIAQAIIHSPELVILDEPMSGLDPIGRRDVKDLILGLRQEGKTVFFSTHIIADVEEICDKTAILVGGALVRYGPVQSLLGNEEREVEITYKDASAAGSANPLRTQRVGRQAEVKGAIEKLWSQGHEVLGVRAHRYGLEKVFLDAVASRPLPATFD